MTQLQLFNYQPQHDETPHPLIIAEKHGFNLSYLKSDNPADYLYHVPQWIDGLTNTAAESYVWTRIKSNIQKWLKQTTLANLQEYRIEKAPFKSDNGKTYQVYFASAQYCYRIALEIPDTMNNDRLEEIKHYLSSAGAFADKVRLDPEWGIETLKPLAAIKREKRIALHEQYGLGDKPQVLRLKARHDVAEEHKLMLADLFRVCTNPDIARLTNAEYYALFGANAATLKNILNTKSVRDGFDTYQLEAIKFAESSLRRVLATMIEATNEQVEHIISVIMPPIGNALKVVCEAIGIDYITGQPLLGGGK